MTDEARWWDTYDTKYAVARLGGAGPKEAVAAWAMARASLIHGFTPSSYKGPRSEAK